MQQKLTQLLELQASVESLNPLFNHHYPIAIAMDGQFMIYDMDSQGDRYVLVKQAPAPFPIPDGVRAAFPLAEYDGKCCAVVTPDAFDSIEEMVLVLHEFVHCYQNATCEDALKGELEIARIAEQEHHHTWELDSHFPYESEPFVQGFQALLSALDAGNETAIRDAFADLRSVLTPHEAEYMAWQMWKEGYARWVENRIQRHLGLPVNRYGAEQPYSRISFYVGGADYFKWLAKRDEGAVADLSGLFYGVRELFEQ
jgi:hypothetical protein